MQFWAKNEYLIDIRMKISALGFSEIFPSSVKRKKNPKSALLQKNQEEFPTTNKTFNFDFLCELQKHIKMFECHYISNYILTIQFS